MKAFGSVALRTVGLCAALISGGSCGAADQTTLVVSIAGLQPDITTLHLTATLAGSQTVKEYAAAPVIGLQLPEQASGQLELSIGGLGADGCPLARGVSTVQVSPQRRLDASLELVADGCSTNHLELACRAGSCDGVCAAGYTDCDGNKQVNGCETQGACMLGFQPAQGFNVGADPYSIVVGDFDGDARADLSFVNPMSDFVSVLLGNGQGGFGGAVTFAVGANYAPRAVAAGDVNGDRKTDLVVANLGVHSVSVLLGDGKGRFSAPVDFAADKNPSGIVIADFNGDQALDLAVANFGANVVSVLIGDGKGGFMPQLNPPRVGMNPVAIAVGNFDGDKALDLAVVNNGSNTVSVLIGDGKGGFTPQPNPLPVGVGPAAISVGDFNSDRKLDLAVTNNGSNTVSVLLGDATGGFGAAVPFATGMVPSGLAIGDFNGDQRLDLAVANYKSDSVSVLLGNGMGGFGTAYTFAVGVSPNALAIGDFNGDQKLDLATTNLGSNSVSVLINRSQ